MTMIPLVPVLYVVLVVALAVLAVGMLYQALGSRRDARFFTGSGRHVSLDDGSQIFVYELGAGEPTVLFESGIGATSLNWRRIQQGIAANVRTVSYDRAGLGWSSPCRTARTPANVSAELHQALVRGAIDPPYILVGHSFGGLVLRRFASAHPEEVAGMVLVDPMRCEEWSQFNPAKQAELRRGRRLVRIASLLARFGLARLALTSLFRRSGRLWERLSSLPNGSGRFALDRIRTEVGKMPREVWPVIAAHWSRPAFYRGMRIHIESIPATVEEMESAEPVTGIPILVLTPDRAEPLDAAALARIGDCARQSIVPSSGHWIHLDQPDLVIESIREMIQTAGSEKSVPAAQISFIAR
jgi:pimeloyl-ACP methyl ester carboxylesterase